MSPKGIVTGMAASAAGVVVAKELQCRVEAAEYLLASKRCLGYAEALEVIVTHGSEKQIEDAAQILIGLGKNATGGVS